MKAIQIVSLPHQVTSRCVTVWMDHLLESVNADQRFTDVVYTFIKLWTDIVVVAMHTSDDKRIQEPQDKVESGMLFQCDA